MSFVLWNEIVRRTRFEGIVATMIAAMLHSVGRAEIQIGFVGFFDGFLDDGRYLETRAQELLQEFSETYERRHCFEKRKSSTLRSRRRC